MHVVRLENWSVVMNKKDPYFAPEQVPKCLAGNVYGHHKHPDGKKVWSSEIANINGRHVQTISGTIYLLGEVEPAYAAWVLLTTGKPLDSENPIRFVDKPEVDE